MTSVRESRSRFRVVSTLAAFLILLAIGLLYLVLQNEQREQRQRMTETTEKRISQLASAVASRMNIAFRNIEFIMRELGRGQDIGPVAYRRFAQSLLSAFPGRAQLQFTLTDATGNTSFGIPEPPARSNLRDTPQFRFHLDHADQLYIGKPEVDPASGIATIVLSQSVMLEGRFAGVAIVRLSTNYVSDLLSTIELRPQDVISLHTADGDTLASNRRPQALPVMATLPFAVSDTGLKEIGRAHV